MNEDKSHGHNFTPKRGEDTAFTIRTAPGSRVDDNFIKTVGYYSNSQNGRVITSEGVSTAMENGEKDGMPKVIVNRTDTTICLNSKVDGKQPSLEHRIYDSDGISTALTTGFLPSVATYRIRKLTPRECFRLMGVDDEDIDKIQAAGISNSQQYKLAGNSIVVDVLYHIFRKAFCETHNENQQQTLF